MTTILAVRHKGNVAVGGDGQVTLGDTVVKHTAHKIRRLHENKVLVGFAGTTADAMALVDKFDGMLKKYQGAVPRAAVELAKEWRTDKVLRRLESLLLAVDKDHMLLISGNGDVIEPDEPVAGIGSGGAYATAAAQALIRHSSLDAKQIVTEALRIASSLCVYSNEKTVIEEL
jgi:ATP-dependent HslUV protease subunit HslV